MKSEPSDRIKIPPGFWSSLQQLGVNPHDVTRKASLPLSIVTESVVTSAQYFAIWHAYSELIGDTAKGMIELATAFETAKYPPTVLATYHARDYRDALHRMTRYKQLCPPENLKMTEEGEDCILELDWQNNDQSGPPMLIGITLTCLLELGRRGTGKRLMAQSVEFSQPMGDVQTLEAYFGCRIKIGTKSNRLILHRNELDSPFVSYNEELLDILTPALDTSLHEQQRTSSMPETVKWIMKRHLTAGRPTIETIAKELGMSERTLQRRLACEQTSFKHLLTEARHEQARQYLADPALDIKEVAFLIGYEDQNSFYRAFRLWEGDTPANWRTGHLEKHR